MSLDQLGTIVRSILLTRPWPPTTGMTSADPVAEAFFGTPLRTKCAANLCISVYFITNQVLV